eukprot:49769_1
MEVPLEKVPDITRNISIVAHVDHGKSTLTDSLVTYAGYLQETRTGSARWTDTREDEQTRGITIKSAAISLDYVPDGTKDLYNINVIDSPGHIDFSSEVTAALRITDGAVVVVDVVEGVAVQTQTVLRQALAERVKPILVLNKIDRSIMSLKNTPEEFAERACRVVEQVNAIIATYVGDDSNAWIGSDFNLNWEDGSVIFASGKMGWAFTVPQFEKIYQKFQPKANLTCKKLSTTKNLANLIFKPIWQMFAKADDEDMDGLKGLMSKLGIAVPASWEGGVNKLLIKALRDFVPAHKALLDSVIFHLPNPRVAQKYRVPILFDGRLEGELDAAEKAIGACQLSKSDEDMVLVYVSKMIPTDSSARNVTTSTRFVAFGRVFCGTVKPGMQFAVVEHLSDASENPKKATAQRAVSINGAKTITVDAVAPGSICGLVGVDGAILKTATLIYPPSKAKEVGCFHGMRYSVSPVVRVAVTPKNPSDMPKLLQGLRRLQQSDPLVKVDQDATGGHVVCGAGELHVDVCLQDLERFAGIGITRSDPVVPYRESVDGDSEKIVNVKSDNKHNRLFGIARSMNDDVAQDIEDGLIGKCGEGSLPTSEAHRLWKRHGWILSECKKVFGLSSWGCVLVDSSHGVNHLSEARDSVRSALLSCEGVLANEPIRAVRYELMDATLHNDPVHRCGRQLGPAARRMLLAAQLWAKPILLEPIYLAEVQCDEAVMGGVYSTLSNRRGVILSDDTVGGVSSLHAIRAHLPVAESLGLAESLRAATAGRATPQCVFSHWQRVPGDPLEEG